MPTRNKTVLLCVTMFLAGAVAAGNAQAEGNIILEKTFPTQQEQVRIQVMDDSGLPVTGANVSVTYRPGSSVSETSPIGRSAAGGTLHWTPTAAGIATITATWLGLGQDEVSRSTTVSVRFRTAPIDGIFIMIVAGLVLIVGSVIRVYKLLRAPDFN